MHPLHESIYSEGMLVCEPVQVLYHATLNNGALDVMCKSQEVRVDHETFQGRVKQAYAWLDSIVIWE